MVCQILLAVPPKSAPSPAKYLVNGKRRGEYDSLLILPLTKKFYEVDLVNALYTLVMTYFTGKKDNPRV